MYLLKLYTNNSNFKPIKFKMKGPLTFFTDIPEQSENIQDAEMDKNRKKQEQRSRLNAQLRYMRQVALPQLLLVYMIININGLSSHIAPEFLNEFAGHASAPEMGCKPMSAAVWAEMVLHLV